MPGVSPLTRIDKARPQRLADARLQVAWSMLEPRAVGGIANLPGPVNFQSANGREACVLRYGACAQIVSFGQTITRDAKPYVDLVHQPTCLYRRVSV